MFVLKNLTFATMILYQLGLEMTWVVITLALGCVQAKQHILEAQDATCWKCYSNSDDCKSPCNCNPDDEDCGCTNCSIEGANCYIDTRDF